MPEAQRQEQQSSGWTVQAIVRTVGTFFLIQFALNQFLGGNKTQVTKGASSPAVATGPIPSYSPELARQSPVDNYNAIPQQIAPMWPKDVQLDIAIYVSPSLIMPSLKKMPSEALVVNEKAFRMGDSKDKREIHTSFPVPKEVQNNGTLWAHFYVAQAGSQLDPLASDYEYAKAYHFFRPFTQYLVKKRVAKTRNLLSATNETDNVDEPKDKTPTFANYYHPNFTISVVPDSGVQNYPNMHPAMRQFVTLETSGARDPSGQNGWYYPIVYVNTFWQLRNQMTEVNSTVTELPLYINLNNMRNWMFGIVASIDEGMKVQAQKAATGEMTTSGDGSEFEEFKRILLESNVYLLATTGVASVLHMIFEMLAFKNDVSHWRKKKDNVGTSVRTILANVVMQSIIFLYLMDNNENTSWMILFGQGMGIVIEAWKITKTVNVRIRPSPPGSLLPYKVAFEDKHKLSETEQKTQEYDQIAFKYLYMVAVPLLGAYAVYSLIYETHKSWYSFIITTLVGSVYAYGFLMMVPSLYINYRLKSVAHMPAKTMMYKFLNTFIDDLFAFTIKMPTLHRLATLRDDVIFFIYLYQAWKYKVDYSRVNEFGQGGDEEEEEEKLANKPLTSPPDSDTSVKVAVEDAKRSDVKVSAKASGQGAKDGGRRRK